MDARIRYSKMMIKNSFIRLLRDKPLSKITVTAICESADINRATFYKYYTSPVDLLQKMEAEIIFDLQKISESINADNMTELLIALLNKAKENGELYTALFSEHGDSDFVNRVFSLCYQATQAKFVDLLPSLTQAQQEWFYCFLLQGGSGIMYNWVRGGMKEEPLEVAQFITRLTLTLLGALCPGAGLPPA